MRRSQRGVRVAAAIVMGLGGATTASPAWAATAASITAGKVDTAAAAKIISDYRAGHGLPPVKVEAHLMQAAASHAQRMATTDTLDHVLAGEGSFMKRITDSGYQPLMAAENIGAGYRTLADAIIGWERSPPHNANLLNRDVTEIGIALYSTTSGEYHAYWSLVLARPGPPPSVASGVTAGPLVGVTVGPFGLIRRP